MHLRLALNEVEKIKKFPAIHIFSTDMASEIYLLEGEIKGFGAVVRECMAKGRKG